MMQHMINKWNQFLQYLKDIKFAAVFLLIMWCGGIIYEMITTYGISNIVKNCLAYSCIVLPFFLIPWVIFRLLVFFFHSSCRTNDRIDKGNLLFDTGKKVLHILIYLQIYLYFWVEKVEPDDWILWIGIIYISVIILSAIGMHLSYHNHAEKKIMESTLCTYIFVDEAVRVNRKHMKHNFLSMFRFESYAIWQSYVKHSGDVLLCPYWFAQKYLKDVSFQKKKCMIVMDLKTLSLMDEKVRSYYRHVLDSCERETVSMLLLCEGDGKKNKLENEWLTCNDSLFLAFKHSGVQLINIANVNNMQEKYEELKRFIFQSQISMDVDELIASYRSLAQGHNEDKYRYTNQIIFQMYGTQECSEGFYQLLKMAEYIYHYRALCEMVRDENKCSCLKKDTFQSSFGVWEQLQREDRKYSDVEVVQAYRLIRKVLNSPDNTKTISYNKIGSVLSQLRNRYIGHGTMAFSVSEELYFATAQLVYMLVKLFYEDSRVLEISECVLDVKAIKQIDSKHVAYFVGYLLAFQERTPEYLDYCTGQVYSDHSITYELDFKGMESCIHQKNYIQ